MVRKSKQTDLTYIDATSTEDLEQLEGEVVDVLPWDQEFRDWEESVNLSHQRTTLVLYRLDPEGQEPAKQVWRWIDKIPTDHECGMVAGSGKFRALLTIDKGTDQQRYIRNKVFWLDQSYDEQRAAVAQEKAAAAGVTVHQGGRSGRAEFMSELKETLALVQLLQTPQAPRNAWEALPEFQASMGKITKKMMDIHLATFAGQASPAAAGVQVVTNPAVAGEDDQITRKDMLELLMKYGPGILDALGLKEKLAGVFDNMQPAPEV